MLITALVIFVIAALLGLTVAIHILRKRETPKSVAVLHGLFGAAGLVVLLVYALKNPGHLLAAAIVLLVIAALGGAIAFINDLRKKPGPVGLIVIHAMVAVAAVVLVLIVAIR